MSIITILYNLLLMPLELIFEFTFNVLMRVFDAPFFSLIGLSLIVNILCLPLYKRADAIQMEENERQKAMSGWVEHIKKTFKGDERYMMLNTYYRQQNYKPFYSLRGSISLLLQIPFFMVAYRYLSGLSDLQGASFWVFSDLGAPDRLLNIGNLTLNILPILMTLLNVVSAMIYLRGLPLSQKIQTYGLAVIFLVLLYNSPSGLVIYWTCNQVFSLLKNVFMRLIQNRKVLGILVGCLGLFVFLYLLLTGKLMNGKRILVALLFLAVCMIPLVTSFRSDIKTDPKKQIPVKYLHFLFGCIFLTTFLGIVIPLSVIGASAGEFYIGSVTPATIVISNLCIYAGYFLVWFHVFYYLSKPSVRVWFSCILLIISGITLLDFFLFGRKLGTVSTYIVFDNPIEYETVTKIVNTVCVLLIIGLIVFLFRKIQRFIPYVYIILIACSFAMIVSYTVRVNHTLNEVKAARADEYQDEVITLSREGKNVIIFELDRAINAYIPYIMQERPELKEIYSGFVYYPNTISFGMFTNFGVPAVYGGYEYVPWEMNQRSEESLKDKHNEALLLMPELFTKAGYKVTIVDPPYAGAYKWVTDLSLYDGYENVNAFTHGTRYLEKIQEDYNQYSSSMRIRNFFYYSILKSAPVIVQKTIYDSGNYFSSSDLGSFNASETFLANYGVLASLEEITVIDELAKGSMFMINNNATHEPSILDPDTYEPTTKLDFDIFENNDRFVLENGDSLLMDDSMDIAHYDINMAAILKIADYIKFLKEEGIYDNCRIILTADHGRFLGEVESLIVDDLFDAQSVNPIMMVKDFGASGEIQSSDQFMTNADVPILAMEGIIEDPINPFTGNKVTSDYKYTNDLLVTTSNLYEVDENNGNVFELGDAPWYRIKDNIFVKENWTRIETD